MSRREEDREGELGEGGTTRIGLKNDYVEYKYPHRRTPRRLALLKGRVPHCYLSGKLPDNIGIPPSFQTLHGLNNVVVTEAAVFGAKQLPTAVEGSLTVCSSCRCC